MGTIHSPNRGYRGNRYWDGKKWRISKALNLDVSDEELDRRALRSMPASCKSFIPSWPSALGNEREVSEIYGTFNGVYRNRGYTAQD